MLLSVHTLGVLGVMDPENSLRTGTEYIGDSHLNFSFDGRQKLIAGSTDPAFDPPDWTNEDNMVSDNGPLLRSNWEPAHCDERTRPSATFYQALLLAQAALEYLDANRNRLPRTSYQRYFAGQSATTVRAVFRALLNPNYRRGDSLLTIPNPKFLYMGKSDRTHPF